ncbi:hypothetical protein [Levilactobacillus namurensis]|uniref:hypothetical protein n=1 Tax=Levilactobacillus namurensis TaxID=380393 RepID=UPI00222EFA4C|nr:hypothetical protein [Levilactobacillus namurensis]MCW3777397.1 hypothetical protein [Levilactobacillus namurensis]MDT7018536.1 hypothetical protein [Levilactobacillus namurensis]WNN64481.1 hypothetical protein RIN67_07100 [Levilactobacillus namurensis]
MKRTLRTAVRHANQWLVFGVVLDVLMTPLGWLRHRPAFGGIITLWWQSHHKAAMTLVLVLTLMGCWLVLVLFFWGVEGLRWAMGRNDWDRK